MKKFLNEVIKNILRLLFISILLIPTFAILGIIQKFIYANINLSLFVMLPIAFVLCIIEVLNSEIK